MSLAFAANLLSPPILFFLLGAGAVAVRSNLDLPAPIPRFLALYLLLSIGFRGGVELSHASVDREVIATLVASLSMAVLIPVYTFAWLRRRLDRADAAAIAAAYGSVSAVTFATALDFVGLVGMPHGGHMVAALALMESPAIVVGLWLARNVGPANDTRSTLWPNLRHALVDGTVVMLLGSFVIGLVTGERGDQAIAPFTRALFQGALCLFLLDMGMVAARRLATLDRRARWLVAFGIVVPLINALIGAAVASIVGMAAGNAFLFCVLCASASYIAVPAAMRQALPAADAGLYVAAAIGITFPFNILVGLPLYLGVVRHVWP